MSNTTLITSHCLWLNHNITYSH
ncbi:hypothetical protein F383_34002 [Gossypium arboreum]|uniref:Uncharacterized protein n=1 Tax=Gossypium arboreum TaxID=29729 RepID=A0A0B0PQF2_GOSAR|nr:hypothetical protein F383_13243 [Gossypium arboreum]KHG27215.1 hypothetical protein F383_34002 [Gossypium arboreum]